MGNPRFVYRLVAACGLTACSSNPPLLFSDSVSFGLQLGTDAAAAGGAVTLGLKIRSLAVVPVSTIDDTGVARAIRGSGGNDVDALSVFASFNSSADSPTADNASSVKVGQMFATGTAAQLLTQGLACHMGASSCPTKDKTPAAETASALAAAKSAKAASASADAASTSAAMAAASAKAAQDAVVQPNPPAVVSATDRPYQRPLVYARSDTLGIDISGSTAVQGTTFTLGYSTQNLALVPVVAAGAGGKVSGLNGRDGDDKTGKDAFSVLGQFNASTQTNKLGYGLDRYFATGVAAQHLADGMRASLASAKASDPAGK